MKQNIKLIKTDIDNNENNDNSWEISGNYFQENIQKDRWIATLKASRKPLGKLIFLPGKSQSNEGLGVQVLIILSKSS